MTSPHTTRCEDIAIGGTADRPSPWPRRAVIALLVLSLAVLAAYGSRFGTDPGVVDSPLIGRAAPDFDLPLLEGVGTVALSELRGDIVVVNFWASWCVPCREEHPDLLLAAERYRDDGVTFVGVVYQDGKNPAIRFLDELGRGYDHVMDEGSRTAIDFGVFGIPETFFIDRAGVVAAKVIGRSDTELLTRTIEAMLDGRTPESVSRAGYETQP